MEFIQIYWPVFLVALVIGIIVGLLVLRPKQNVRLSDSAPVRPHMNVEQSHEGRTIADEAAAAASDIAGPIIGAEVHAELPGAEVIEGLEDEPLIEALEAKLDGWFATHG